MNEAALAVPSAGRLVENLMFFARTLRAAGLPIGIARLNNWNTRKSSCFAVLNEYSCCL